MKKHCIMINPNKLHTELIKGGIVPLLVQNDLKENEYIAENTYIVLDKNTDMELVQQIIDAHNPTPLPEPSAEIELLRIEQAKANAEMIELMMSMFGGGY